MKYFLATLFMLVGVGFIITAGVIKHQVGEGRNQISQAKEGVDAVKRLSNLSKYTAPAGDIVASQADKKIARGEQKADRYQSMSNWFMTIGILLVAFSALAFLFFWKGS